MERRAWRSITALVFVFSTATTACSNSSVSLAPVRVTASATPAAPASPATTATATAAASPTPATSPTAAASPTPTPAATPTATPAATATPTPIKTATPTPTPKPPTPTPVPSTVSVALAPAIPAMSAMDDGKQNPVVMISVAGSKPFPVTLDTGSSGLRVYADAFNTFGGSPNPGTTADSYGLGGDRTLFGTVGTDDVRFTGVNGAGTLDFGPIDYEYVTYICANGTTPPCTSEVPKYEALGLYGTFGVRPDARGDTSGLVYTPIGSLPGNLGKGYIVSLGNGTAEKLILGLTPANRAGFNTYAIGSTLTNGRYLFNNFATVPFCYTITSADGTTSFSNTCGTLDFLTDTGGNPSLQFQQAPTGPESLVDAKGNLVAGTTVSVTLGGTPVWSFTAGSCTDYDKFGVAFKTPVGAENNGVVPFFYDDVMYDLAGGLFGFRSNGMSTPPFCSGMQL